MQKKRIPDPEADSPLKKYGITLKQEMFCQYYTSATEFFGHGANSYAQAYDYDTSDPKQAAGCRHHASVLLTNPKILKRIDSLLEEAGLNDQHVDKQLLMLIQQCADFGTKLGAIKEYNKLKQRIFDRLKVEVTPPVTVIEIVSAGDRNTDNENQDDSGN